MKRFLIFCLLIILFEPGFSLDRKSYLQLSFENSERKKSLWKNTEMIYSKNTEVSVFWI